MIKVSIIVPIYNVEQYLDKCLQSLINQSLTDIEIICVNDGSTDNSLTILEKFAKQDNRIKVINQPNQGQGVARNNAIKLASGEYIGFADPDDWLSEKMFKTLYSTAKEYDCDLVESSFVIHNENRGYTKKQKNKLHLPIKKVFKGNQIKNYIFSAKLAVWNKLYKTSFIKENHIEFMDTKRGEDIIFTVLSRTLANRIVYINAADYQYRIRNNNVTTKTEYYTEFYKNFRDKIASYNIFNQLESQFYDWVLHDLSHTYKKLGADEKAAFIKEVQSFLPQKQLSDFYKRNRNILSNIFSVYNTFIDGRKYKVFKIFGIKFNVKY